MKVTDQIVSLLPNNWSETVGEQQYLDAIVEDSGEAISLHAATCGRVRSFLKYVDEAREFGFRGWGFYNNEDLIDSLQKNLIDPEPFVFNSCNSLVSVLELMTHEVYVSLRIAVGEKEKIYFNREHKKLAKISGELSIKIKELSESMEIRYLYKIRNRIHHRSSVSLGARLTTKFEIPGPIIPSALPRDLRYFLPDAPDAMEPGFTFENEIVSTLTKIYTRIASAADGIYGSVAAIRADSSGQR